MSLVMKDTDPLHKVSIIPRGMAALGYTMQLPLQDRYLVSKSELFSRICVLLGGRVAEKLVFNEVSSGAHNDFEVATGLARRMVTEFGMTDRLGVLSLGRTNNPLFLGRELVEHKDYSEETARVIDEEIKRIIDEAYAQSEAALKGGIDKLKTLSSLLLEKEILDAAEVRNVLGFPQPPEHTGEDEEGLVFAPTPRGDSGSQL
jgi:cell division protease FtsH